MEVKVETDGMNVSYVVMQCCFLGCECDTHHAVLYETSKYKCSNIYIQYIFLKCSMEWVCNTMLRAGLNQSEITCRRNPGGSGAGRESRDGGG